MRGEMQEDIGQYIWDFTGKGTFLSYGWPGSNETVTKGSINQSAFLYICRGVLLEEELSWKFLLHTMFYIFLVR